jgi:ribonucleotide monophosphatase NagD (HAD superfamily)
MSDMSASTKLTTLEEYAGLIDKFDTFLFDCDGVIWSGPKLIPGVKEVIPWLRSKGKRLLRNLLRAIYLTFYAAAHRQERLVRIE